MKTAFCYCRDSGGPGQDRSVRDQRAELERWAEAEGYLVLRWYLDEARSGTTDDRDEFRRMISDAEREKPTAVVVWDSARWSRNQDEAAYYRARVRRAGVNVVSLNDPIPDGPMGRIIESVIDFSSEHFIKNLRANVKRGHRALLAQGFIPGAQPPIGYRAERVLLGENPRTGKPRYGARWLIDPEAASLIRRAFELRAAGASIKTIMRETGLVNTRQGMHHVLRNPAYKGVYSYGGEEWPGVVPAIVDAELWQAAQVNLDIHPRTAAADYLLTGLLRCEYCGYAMSGFSSSRQFKSGRMWRRRYYICAARNTKLDGCGAPLVRADELESDVIATVFASLLDPEPFAAFVAAVREAQNMDVSQNRAARLDRDIAEAEGELRNLVRLAARGRAVDMVAEEAATVEARIADLRRERAQVGTLPRILALQHDALAAYVQALRDKLETGDVAAKRWVLHQVIARMTYGDRLRIEFRAPEMG